ncbi:hypothetical protein ACLB1O_17900 [Escherichia coli]
MSDNRPQQVLAISSAKQGEGRSLLASLLANSFSFDQKTLLLDLDFFNRDGAFLPSFNIDLCGSCRAVAWRSDT